MHTAGKCHNNVPSAITWVSGITGHSSLAMKILKKENVGHLNKWIL